MLSLSRTNNNIRGATLIHGFPCARQDTIISPATDVCLHVAEYSADVMSAFDCTLCGPFDKLFLT